MNLLDSKILVIVTGGMIMQEFDSEVGYLPNRNPREILDSVSKNIKMDKIELLEFSNIDSCTFDLEIFLALGKLVQRKINHDGVDGIVIISGSDIMEILAYFLHRCIYTHGKPIVITGSTKILTESDFDGTANLTNAIKQIANPETSINGYGVTINFAGKIHSPIYVTKEHSFAIDPFTSGNYGVLGMMHTNRIDWRNNPKRSSIIPIPARLASVPIVYAYPGASPDFLDGFFGKHEGLVVVSYGSGNVSESMYFAMKKAVENGLKVVLTTNCKYGGVFSEYGGIGGNQSLKDLGVIMTDDLGPYQAMIVATLLFANQNVSKEVNQQIYFSNKIMF